jgi:cytochrome c biogenesis protein CcmG/thiol:disulfide interchange protein DsbE
MRGGRMTVKEQWAWVVAIVLVLIGGAFAATRALRDELFPVTLGSEAPAFEGSTLDAQAVKRTLDDYRGKVVLLNIWATWCQPCIVEMPTMEALHREFKDTDLRIVAVSIDQPQAENAIRQFVKELGLTFEILHDPEGDITRAYQATGYPETFVIGRDGVIRKKVIGAVDWNSEGNRALVRQLLAERGA